MKKILSLLITCTFLFLLVACSNSKDNTETFNRAPHQQRVGRRGGPGHQREDAGPDRGAGHGPAQRPGRHLHAADRRRRAERVHQRRVAHEGPGHPVRQRHQHRRHRACCSGRRIPAAGR